MTEAIKATMTGQVRMSDPAAPHIGSVHVECDDGARGCAPINATPGEANAAMRDTAQETPLLRTPFDKQIPVLMNRKSSQDSGSADARESGSVSINRLIAKLREMYSKKRDMEWTFYTSLQQMAFDKQVGAMATKNTVIGFECQANSSRAAFQIASGVLGFGSAALGDREIAAKTGASLDQTVNGIGGVTAAAVIRQKEDAGLLGDVETGVAGKFSQSVDESADKAIDDSRQMDGVSTSLIRSQDRMSSAVKLYQKKWGN